MIIAIKFYNDQIEYLKQNCYLYNSSSKILQKGFRESEVYISNIVH